MFVEKLAEEEYYDKYFDEDIINDLKDYSNMSDNEINFAIEIRSLLQDIIFNEENSLHEEFTSNYGAKNHFYYHCLSNKSIKSKRSSVYYDFTDINDYMQRENIVSDYIKNTKYIITDISDTNLVVKYIHILFEGNKTVNFTTACQLQNENGRVSISIHSWANKATTNYLQNTVDFVVQTPDNKTITIFPVDANYLENKINAIIKRNGFQEICYNK